MGLTPDPERTGTAFFGPVISPRPSDADAVELWDHVLRLARFGGCAELERSLRERTQLQVFGGSSDIAGKAADRHQGSRRQKH